MNLSERLDWMLEEDFVLHNLEALQERFEWERDWSDEDIDRQFIPIEKSMAELFGGLGKFGGGLYEPFGFYLHWGESKYLFYLKDGGISYSLEEPIKF